MDEILEYFKFCSDDMSMRMRERLLELFGIIQSLPFEEDRGAVAVAEGFWVLGMLGIGYWGGCRIMGRWSHACW